MPSLSPDLTTEWEGGSLSELVAALLASAQPVRIEVVPPGTMGSNAGEVHLIAGGLADAFAGSLRRDDAMAALQLVEGARFLVGSRLPDPETGSLAVAGPREGSLKDRPLAALMRYCEDYVLSCSLEITRGQEKAVITYKRGEITGTLLDGADATERLPEVLAWSDGGYAIILPAPVLPPGHKRDLHAPASDWGARPERKRHSTLPMTPAVSQAGVPTGAPPERPARQSATMPAAAMPPTAPSPPLATFRPPMPAMGTQRLPALPPPTRPAPLPPRPAPLPPAASFAKALATQPAPPVRPLVVPAAAMQAQMTARGTPPVPAVPAPTPAARTSAQGAAAASLPAKAAAPDAPTAPALPRPAAPVAPPAPTLALPRPAAPTSPPAFAPPRPAAPAAPATPAARMPALPRPAAPTASAAPAAHMPALPRPAAPAAAQPAAPAAPATPSRPGMPTAPAAPAVHAPASPRPAAPAAPAAHAPAPPRPAAPAPPAAHAPAPPRSVAPALPAAHAPAPPRSVAPALPAARAPQLPSAHATIQGAPAVLVQAKPAVIATPAAPASPQAAAPAAPAPATATAIPAMAEAATSPSEFDEPPVAPVRVTGATAAAIPSNDLRPASGTIEARPKHAGQVRPASAPIEVAPDPEPAAQAPALAHAQAARPARKRGAAHKRDTEQPVRVYILVGLAIGLGIVLAYWTYWHLPFGHP